MKARAHAVAALLALMAGCASLTPEQQDAVRRVQVRNVSPAWNCQNLGIVTGSPTSEGASGMRAKAVRMGGNVLSMRDNGEASVLYCPTFAVATPDADPADP
jgi:hypothetical protein